jgi:hypothetical protein
VPDATPIVPALYSSDLKELAGRPFRLRSTDTTVNVKSSYLWWRLDLPRFYGQILDPEDKPWTPGNFAMYVDNELVVKPYDDYRIQTFDIPEHQKESDEQGNPIPVVVTANDGTPIPAGKVYGMVVDGTKRHYEPGNFRVGIVHGWETVGKGSKAKSVEWLECDFDRVRDYAAINVHGKPEQDKPEKVTTFQITMKDAVTLKRKDKDGNPVTKTVTDVQLEAGHYLALALQAKIADKSEDGGNPLHYWMAWNYDGEKTDNALKWTVKATKMTDTEIAALPSPATEKAAEEIAALPPDADGFDPSSIPF